jgi:hypothetical protein
MLSSSKHVDKSYSVISNDEIWKGDKSCEDSKHFFENFKKINKKKSKKNKNLKKDSNSKESDNNDILKVNN